MRLNGFLTMACVAITISGCVSQAKYDARLEQIRNLRGEVVSLEEALQQSESTRQELKFDLQAARDNLAKLKEQHEQLKTRTAEAGAPTGPESHEGKRQEFVEQLAGLQAKLAGAEVRIRELSDALAKTEVAARKVPSLEAGIQERNQRIEALTASLRSLEKHVAQLQSGAAELSRSRTTAEEKEDAVAGMRRVLNEEITRGEIVVRELRDKLVVTMKEQVLFDSGSARISKSGQRTLNRIARVLQKVNNNMILVEGHTDSKPISRRGGRYSTNWDLSAARASNVVKHLEHRGKIAPRLLALAGYGSHLPAADNGSESGRRLNRRIEIALVPMETERWVSSGKTRTAMR